MVYLIDASHGKSTCKSKSLKRSEPEPKIHTKLNNQFSKDYYFGQFKQQAEFHKTNQNSTYMP
uniref:Uncharacterized protein n=1 Tax=Daucus carota subsp. sativus TaxID=79200 RepID=A0A164ZJ71_DAUCS